MLAGLFKLGTAVIGFAMATALFWAGIWYAEWAPAGWPNLPVHFLIFKAELHLPGAGAIQAERDKLEISQAHLRQCEMNDASLESGIQAQDAAVARLAAEGQERQARAQQAVDDAQAAVAAADRRAAQIMSARPAGASECVQAEALIRGVVR